jgi:hypothetical protein
MSQSRRRRNNIERQHELTFNIDIPHTTVSFTDENTDECLILHYREQDIPLHVTEAVDMARKLNEAVLGWFSTSMLQTLQDRNLI